ncbi:MAG: hypothetical protein K9W45_07215 [Candidatus Heimdallarchaeum aukensis]|uniref:Uncharacterized protein n=1 Tax=Candidatus Heimdallarchaeum aukensis TaxID=2876573 RepID=A0A9Y1BIQ4_9ARCH|nr:MAG: hypothetical protein K9W45_07215 [Candidatus Heimdallarchaeum aukensis]
MKEDNKVLNNKKEIKNQAKIEKTQIKAKWDVILLTGFFSSLLFFILDVIIVLIFILGLKRDAILTLVAFEYVLLGEVAIVVIWGACIGNIKQSVVIQKVKEKITKSETINKFTIKEATFNAISYYFAGLFLFIYLIVLHKILQILVKIA